MVKIKNAGERLFQVLDPYQEPRRLVVIEVDAEREVSDELGVHLTKTYPKQFKKVSAGAAKGGES